MVLNFALSIQGCPEKPLLSKKEKKHFLKPENLKTRWSSGRIFSNLWSYCTQSSTYHVDLWNGSHASNLHVDIHSQWVSPQIWSETVVVFMEEIVKQEGHIVDGSLTDAVHVKLVLLHDARWTHYSHPITEVKSAPILPAAQRYGQ